MESGLAQLPLLRRYRTGRNDMLHDFYMPCLSQALTYDRAVGFFTAGAISLASQGFGKLAKREGKVRLVAGPQLEPGDLAALERGYGLRSDELTKRLLAQVSRERLSELDDIARSRFAMLTWLVAEKYLDFKIAVLTHPTGQGIYHEKLGLFKDEWGNEVAFSGSSNESASGISFNFESFSVFRSWISEDQERLAEHREDFEALWSDRTPGLEVVDLPEAVKRRLIELAPEKVPNEILPRRRSAATPANSLHEAKDIYGFPWRPESIRLYDHQREALTAWIDSGARGTLSMATGTGKTITALSGVAAMAAALRQTNRPMFTLIVVPYKILVRQWADESILFGVQPLTCYESAADWVEELSERLRVLRRGHASFALAIATNATFSSPSMQQVLRQVPKDFLIIADEMHNLGSEKALKALPPNATMRLGLSATPERHMDPEGTAAIANYFGSSVFDFPLARALAGGFLAKYYYRPILVNLTEQEAEEYITLSQKIARLFGGLDPSIENLADGALKALLFKRARLIGGAQNKIAALKEAMLPYVKSSKMLVYCSDAGSGPDDLSPQRQLDAVTQMLGTELEMHVHSYTSQENELTRIDIEQRFKADELQALVAIRCLDEGVDLPEVQRAFILASSTNPRQFIQRRGRVLRNAPGKDHAEIYDFAVVPPDDPEPELFDLERRLFRRELERMTEFADHAINGQQALVGLIHLKQRYHLLDV